MRSAERNELSGPGFRPFATRPRIALCVADAGHRHVLAGALDALDVAAEWIAPGDSDPLASTGAADLLLWSAPPPRLDIADMLLDRAALGDFALLVALPDADLDSWADAIGRRGVDVAAASDMEALVRVIGRVRSGARAQRARQGEDDPVRRLRDLGDEVARIAQALAAIPPHPDMVGEPASGYRAQPADTPRPVTAATVRGIIRARRLRDQYFAADLFADPAWDMLLDLTAAQLEGHDVAVSSLCIAASVPATTALRWISAMTEQGLLERHADPADRRRIFVRLSAEAEERMRALIAALVRTGGPVV
ncbi:MAG: MarR family transcriptional regulator [Sphingomonas sanxanigenens]|uniref:MarR family transcriptional regulator n=1 Tax=Sphingomonas sanxanigenens TaxID=397260 RepID=A0A2W5C6G9_9SPHN|nr:MAG: MarR family transcriptional regulator [Sphingomonas sanxanigenens]